MPEYLTPGVYVEETTFRAKSIEGVPTSTTGMVGATRSGPLSYPVRIRGRTPSEDTTVNVGPRLVTSFTEFERAFGGLEPIELNGTAETNYLAHAARAFFGNGGRRLYVTRVFPFPVDTDANGARQYFATRSVGGIATWVARWPGRAGSSIRISAQATRGKNAVITTNGVSKLVGLRTGALVEVGQQKKDGDPITAADLRLVVKDPATEDWALSNGGAPIAPDANTKAYPVQFRVTVQVGDRADSYSELALSPEHPRSMFKVLDVLDPADVDSMVWLDAVANDYASIAALAAELVDPANHGLLAAPALDDPAMTEAALRGRESDPDRVDLPALGLGALAEIDDIAIVAVPDTVRFTDPAEAKLANDHLIEHCQRLRYRIAIVDPPPESSLAEVREFRSQFDTKYAALYYPWIETIDPSVRPEPGTPPKKLLLPPSGYVAGIYARSDIERGVHKAPANEVITGMTRFEFNVTGDRQAVLNPEGINALRFFEGRSNRVWGARTMSSDPEWKYVNVRRLFIYLEHSIDKATQWAVFEPNNEQLWSNVRQTIEDFLFVTWKTGALMGLKPEEAFFVRCDRTTMTQNDLDNGRLICLIGVAPTYPAEFVIFRIGQWTADARRN